ncbi:MAG: thioredoxin domain-containing protein [Anaerolineae bacterium]|nr:thioredoxin domain-containing protein [Anaerolineae bacterium]
MVNRLAQESSPYLLQHADNPVDWYPWGDEALEKARREDKPIFLSIGYSACHWCHVMAHESFEDAKAAEILNEHFVSIKVDREERPDLDRIYMAAVQALTGGGGWPMSVFLTPDGQPFYGGTYFPPAPRYGMPAFTQVLLAVTDAWQNRRQELVQGGQQLTDVIRQQAGALGAAEPAALKPEILRRARQNLDSDFDPRHGGWGGAPKFPQPMALEFLLRCHHASGDEPALQMVTQTLDAMARGGMYDQLGGGFHRYSVDAQWTIPHFEKMLYDNAQLARVYLHAWQATGDPFYRTIAEETLDYVAREMTDPAGGFYSTQDADSEGEEGKFFAWTPGEIHAVLGSQADAFIETYGVTERGNFTGENILELKGPLEKRAALAAARDQLFQARERRVHPGRDEKVLTSWNGLMLAAFAEAARALDRDDCQQTAENNASFLLRELRTAEGRLYHTWQAGAAKITGYLEDYANLIDGLIELYQTTFEPCWYVAARELAETMIAHFRTSTGFYDTSDDHKALIVRPQELQDNAVPSGNAMAVTALLRLAGLAGDPRYEELAHHDLGAVQELLARHPLGFGQWLQALSYALAQPLEIAIVGKPGAADTQALLAACRAGYRPHQVVAVGPPATEQAVPLLRQRNMVDGQATAYVCVDHACRPPLTGAAALEALR